MNSDIVSKDGAHPTCTFPIDCCFVVLLSCLQTLSANNDVAEIFTEAAETDNKKKLRSVISWNGEADEFTGWKAHFW